jgi:5-oxoprolinase (ATP-hydrolysing)
MSDATKDLNVNFNFNYCEQVMPMVKAVSRGYTTAADAYLTPVIARYLESFRAGFDAGFDQVKTLFMQR